jgi:hypothetical protein
MEIGSGYRRRGSRDPHLELQEYRRRRPIRFSSQRGSGSSHAAAAMPLASDGDRGGVHASLFLRSVADLRGVEIKQRLRRRLLLDAIAAWTESRDNGVDHGQRQPDDSCVDDASHRKSSIASTYDLGTHTSAAWKAAALRERCLRSQRMRVLLDAICEWAWALNDDGNQNVVESSVQVNVEVAKSLFDQDQLLALQTSAAFEAERLRTRCMSTLTASRRRLAFMAWGCALDEEYISQRVTLAVESLEQDHFRELEQARTTLAAQLEEALREKESQKIALTEQIRSVLVYGMYSF